jgi:hypothetical protein
LWHRCTSYAQPGRSYCAAHEQQRDQLGLTGGKRSGAFRRNRKIVMRRAHGVCVCGAPAAVVHHVGRADDDSPGNLIALCDACHAAAHGRTLRA